MGKRPGRNFGKIKQKTKSEAYSDPSTFMYMHDKHCDDTFKLATECGMTETFVCRRCNSQYTKKWRSRNHFEFEGLLTYYLRNNATPKGVEANATI